MEIPGEKNAPSTPTLICYYSCRSSAVYSDTYSEDSVTLRTIQNWFAEFKNTPYNWETRSGRQSEVDEGRLK